MPSSLRPPSLGALAGAAWRAAYELVLLALVALVLLVPVEAAFVRHLDVARTLADDRVVLAPDAALVPGEVLTLWRFQAQWPTPLGTIVVERADPDGALATYDPAALAWPMGRHGRVVAADGRRLTVDVGRELGLEPGDELVLFDGRRQAGRMRLEEVRDGTASGPARDLRGDPVGLGASEYTVRTQAIAGADAPPALAAELAVLGSLFGGWVLVLARWRRWPLDVLGDALRRVRLPTAARDGAQAVLLGILLGILAPTVTARVVDRGAAWLGLAVPNASAWVRPWLGDAVLTAFGLLAAASLATRRSPLDLLRDATRWERSPVARLPAAGRGIALWTLHLVVAWAFASTLWGFLKADLWAFFANTWADAPRGLTPGDAARWGLGHLPRVASAASAGEAAKDLLWSATVVGCMAGYGHSVLAPLWGGGKLRHLDFTVPGWVTNALCYPLLGPAVWQLLPPRPGPDPILVGALPHAVALGVGFALNLLYTVSILGMGLRFGVMTDKGLVDRGFHGVVRHPSYTLEAAMFVALDVTGLTTWREWLSVSSWVWLYWLRSEREDEFMSAANPDYAGYRARVRWKFLPGIW